MENTIVLASNNSGKIAEFQSLFAPLSYRIVPQSNWRIDDVCETGLSFVENALLKARHAAKISGLPAIADDSGLMVTALNGAPSIYSARYAGGHGDDVANNANLLKEMELIDDRRAMFVSVIVYCRHDEDPLPLIATGTWTGEILRAPRGDRGFGYDPLFWLPELGKSAAELTLAEKNQISHRGKALRAFCALFQEN
ncbi:RdgB/HAM1 family non-canonical purine NTP pyrophosphatase [Dichelobacter nodosus]|uniref:dITP/XTP pyrophosphatase n=1 Tax=Dichelobacter nodosus (strain VCS1703A) TaxID=246195 RepID=A5EV73_DICNV|nr:RdgB/HAM1 family non-canonical purine NTP pyrophosphatase [Dichelobacter nodosus]ABQ13700.1 Ham1-like protein [Dichelobacter nodosus VCS1703A]